MRIAFFVRTFPAISETFVLNQITGLIDRGHEVDIHAISAPATQVVHSDWGKYILEKRTYYSDILPANRVQRWVTTLFSVLRSGFLNPTPFSRFFQLTRGTCQYWGTASLWSRGVLFLRRPKYHAVVAHFGPMGAQALELRQAGFFEGKLITFFHGFDMTSFLESAPDGIYERLFRFGDLMLPISYRWADRLKELGCPEKKIKVHRMGIDPAQFVCSKQVGETGGPIRVLSIARLVEKKGIEYAIRAVARLLRDKQVSLTYEIAGDGPLRPQLEQLIQELGISDCVRLLGPLKSSEVRAKLTDCDIFLAPSVTSETGDQEGIPVAIMEAMSFEIPVVSTWHSGIPELVDDGESGYLVPERDDLHLAEKIKELALSPSLRIRMGQLGRKRVETEYHIERLNDRLNQLLAETAGN